MSDAYAAIPRPKSQPRPAAGLDAWVDETSTPEPVPAAPAPKPPARKQVRLHLQVDPDLKKRVKRAAVENDLNLSELVRGLLEDWLEQQGF